MSYFMGKFALGRLKKVRLKVKNAHSHFLTRSDKFKTPVFPAVSSLLAINLLPFESDVDEDNPIANQRSCAKWKSCSLQYHLVGSRRSRGFPIPCGTILDESK
jgi:hypothetical protein